MIKAVIRCEDNSVVAFDENGEIIPLYLGSYTTMKTTPARTYKPGSGFSHYFDTALSQDGLLEAM